MFKGAVASEGTDVQVGGLSVAGLFSGDLWNQIT